MLAYVFDSDGTMQVKVMPDPVAADDNLIVKINCSSICGTDFRTFMKGSDKIKPPRILGHEMAGSVIHAGFLARENDFQVGDRVTVAPAVGCGKCWPCSTGHTNMCDRLTTFGFQYEGTFAEYMEVPAHVLKMGNLLKIPDNVSDEEACLAEPAACALNAQTYLGIGKDDFVVIYGSGFIGCMHAEFALAAGARRVILVEIAENRAQLAKEMIPQAEVVNPSAQDTVEEVMRLTEGRGANVVITALSVPSIHYEAQKIASKMGRISLFGGIAGDGKGHLDSNLIHYKELCVYGVHATTAALLKDVLEYSSSGRIAMKKYITCTYPLAVIEKGFLTIRDENAMKVVIHP